jgi:hypothetical protein
LMKRIWAAKKAKAALKSDEELLFNTGPTAVEAVESGPEEWHEGETVVDAHGRIVKPSQQARYRIAQGNTIIASTDGPMTYQQLVVRLQEMFNADPLLREIEVLETKVIKLEVQHELRIQNPITGKEDILKT